MEINIGIIAIIVLAIAILAILASGYVRHRTKLTSFPVSRENLRF